MGLKLSELIAAYGDDKVMFQILDTCTDSLNLTKRGITKVTFGAEGQPFDYNGTKNLGLVVWLDRDRVKEIVAASKAALTIGGDHGE